LSRLPSPVDGLFFWSFYRARDSELCLRELLAYALGLPRPPEVSASYCVDHLLPRLRAERWAVVLDGAEVAQHEAGPWHGRFIHPELGRLLEGLAAEPAPGVVVLTTRFPLPTLERRPFARLICLAGLDTESARGLLASLGVRGAAADLDRLAALAGHHAKAVELLGTYAVRFAGGAAQLPELPAADLPGASDEERCVARVLAVFQQELPAEAQDVLALATAFREPATEGLLLDYLRSAPVENLLHAHWGRAYTPFRDRPGGWLEGQIEELVGLRLLERVGPGAVPVIDAHPLVRRSFEHARGPAGRHEGARARAGFLHSRPDRSRPASLEEAREEIELFHAHCDAGLWGEADGVLVALENPKHRFLAPALERDLLLSFFPAGDWRHPPLWPGFGRWRSLAICLEMLGQYEEALEVYASVPANTALCGDALIALGRLGPLLAQARAGAPWEPLWQAYRCHALAVAGRRGEALALARSLVPLDVYEWVHVFECRLRTWSVPELDLGSILACSPPAGAQRWADLARRRMRADYRRVTGDGAGLDEEYAELVEAYDRGGLAWERALTRLSQAAWLLEQGWVEEALTVNEVTLELARVHGLRLLRWDALRLAGRVAEASALAGELGFTPALRLSGGGG
jgi:hypothetical protein